LVGSQQIGNLVLIVDLLIKRIPFTVSSVRISITSYIYNILKYLIETALIIFFVIVNFVAFVSLIFHIVLS